MLRLAVLVSSLLIVGCSSTRTNALEAVDSSDSFAKLAPDAEVVLAPADTAAPAPASEPSAAAGTADLLGINALDPTTPMPAAAPAQEEKDLHGNRFTLKGGYYSSSEDEFDDGWIVNLSWSRYFTKLIALELEVGYLDADGSNGGVDFDLWALPVMVNGRFNIPIWLVDFYAGLGIGTFYYNVDTNVGADDDGWLLGGNAFIGGTVNVGEALALGLEAKYYVTDDTDLTNSGIDAVAVMLTVGFSR